MSIEYVTMRVNETYTNSLKAGKTRTTHSTRDTTLSTATLTCDNARDATCVCHWYVWSVQCGAVGGGVERPHTLLFFFFSFVVYLYRSPLAPRGEVRSRPRAAARRRA